MVVHQQRQNLWIHFVAKLAGVLGQLFHLRRLMDIHLSDKGCGGRGAFGGGGRASDRASAEADRNTDRDKENDVSARSSPHGTGYFCATWAISWMRVPSRSVGFFANHSALRLTVAATVWPKLPARCFLKTMSN